MPASLEELRLQRYLAQAGVASRRRAEALIAEGRVRVNGRVADQPGTKVVAGRDRVTVDGRNVELGKAVHLLVCKPRGRVTAVSDPDGRPTVRDLLPRELGSLHSVGRLDFNSEGALIVTSDTTLVEALARPPNPVGE